MDDELIKVCEMYNEICNRSQFGDRKGMSIKEIKKRFGLKKRDIVVLLQFLNDIADLDSSIEFTKYWDNGEIDDDFDDFDIDSLDEYASDENIYICIYENAHLLKNWITEEDINIQNDTFYHSLKKYDFAQVWDKISTVSDDRLHEFIINKNIVEKDTTEREIKLLLISAILNRNAVEMICYDEYRNRKRKKGYPLGLRYIKLLDTYKVILTENFKFSWKIDLSQIAKITVLNEQHDKSFDIYEYLKKKRIEKVVLEVYNEGNVVKKLDQFLSEFKVRKIKRESFWEYRFMVEDVWMLEKMIKSFGRSVIVKKPDYFREKIYNETKEILDFYQTDESK